MQITINAPDNLPYERISQRVQELEQSLKKEAMFLCAMLFEKNVTTSPQKRSLKRGSAKHLITFVADDFNAPLDDFQDYM